MTPKARQILYKMINLLLIIPLIGTLLILPIGSNVDFNLVSTKDQEIMKSEGMKLKERMKKIALSASLFNLFISIIMWFQFDSNFIQFGFNLIQYDSIDFNLIFNLNFNVNFKFQVDFHFHFQFQYVVIICYRVIREKIELIERRAVKPLRACWPNNEISMCVKNK